MLAQVQDYVRGIYNRNGQVTLAIVFLVYIMPFARAIDCAEHRSFLQEEVQQQGSMA